MLAYITNQGATLVDVGKATYYVEDTQFDRIVKDKQLCESICKELNTKEVLIGTLGQQDSSMCFKDLNNFQEVAFENVDLSRFGFYEKIEGEDN